MKYLRGVLVIASFTFLQACKHPLAIEGEGDIVEVFGTGRGCTLEQFREGHETCTENRVNNDYQVNYKAVPRQGWRFLRWEGPCSQQSDFQHCSFSVPKAGVDWWNETHPDAEVPPSTAVFAPVTGEIGYLLAGTPVAGVSFETPTQEGVTGLDGSFYYEEGETVRFMIGNTLLGEVKGQERVTPFDLAHTPVITGVQLALSNDELYPDGAIDWNSQGSTVYPDHTVFYSPDPFDVVVNITVSLQSLDDDADVENGIVIRPGVSNLFQRTRLNLHQEWDRFLENPASDGSRGAIPDYFPTLRFKVGQANKKRIFSRAHGLVKPAIAMQKLYISLGIDSRTYALCPEYEYPPGKRMECRFDDNGNLIWADGSTFEYDANGNLIRADGSTFEYDANGNLLRVDHYSKIETFQYDAYGNVVHIEEYHPADGDIFEWDWKYDRKGRPILHESGYDQEYPNTTTWEYHNDDTLKYFREYRFLGGGETGLEHTVAWRFDETARPIRYSEEYRSEDVYQKETVEWQHDENGNITEYFSRAEGEELLEETIQHYQFDFEGNLVRYDFDHGGDGNPELTETWEYNTAGQVVSFHHIDVWGNPDRTESWQYEAHGRLIRHESVEDGGGNSIETWQYDGDGRMTNYVENRLTKSWRYDERGNLTRYETQRADKPLLWERWLYDSSGSLIRHEWNEQVPESPDEIHSEQYQTTGWGHIFSGGISSSY